MRRARLLTGAHRLPYGIKVIKPPLGLWKKKLQSSIQATCTPALPVLVKLTVYMNCLAVKEKCKSMRSKY